MNFASIAGMVGWHSASIPQAEKTVLQRRVSEEAFVAERPRILSAGGRLFWLSLGSFVKALWYGFWALVRYLIHHPIHMLLNAAFIGVMAVMLITGSEIHKQMILGKISDQTIDKIIEASEYTRDFDANAAARDGVREFQRVGAPNWIQRESIRAILFHARKAGLRIEDQAVLLATAEIESGFNPMARAATTSACGIFQFVQRTGQLFELSPSECMNPWLNAQSGVSHYLSNVEERVKRSVTGMTGTELLLRLFELSYYLHHDGPHSSNPSNDLKAIVLSGTQFLFRVYHVLQQEGESEQRAPSFTQIFSERLLSLADSIVNSLGLESLPALHFRQRAAAAGGKWSSGLRPGEGRLPRRRYPKTEQCPVRDIMLEFPLIK